VADIEALLAGLSAQLETIDGLRVREEMTGSIHPPAAVLTLEEITYDTTMDRGSDDVEFHVTVFTSMASERTGQKALFEFLAGSGPKSVRAAISADPTLGGAAMYAEVQSVGEVGIAKFADVSYYAARFVVVVGAAG
jgi:hypothetical protein